MTRIWLQDNMNVIVHYYAGYSVIPSCMEVQDSCINETALSSIERLLARVQTPCNEVAGAAGSPMRHMSRVSMRVVNIHDVSKSSGSANFGGVPGLTGTEARPTRK